MTVAAGKPACWPLSFLEYDSDVEHPAGVKHEAADGLSGLKTGENNIKTLVDEIPVAAVFDQGQTQSGNSSGDSDEEDPNNQLEVTKSSLPYVRTVLALTEVGKKHPLTL